MDGGNGIVEESTPEKEPAWKSTLVTIYARVPGELKYLIHSYQSACRMTSFNEAIRRLLESHPDLARHAAMLYNQNGITQEGSDHLWVSFSGWFILQPPISL